MTNEQKYREALENLKKMIELYDRPKVQPAELLNVIREALAEPEEWVEEEVVRWAILTEDGYRGMWREGNKPKEGEIRLAENEQWVELRGTRKVKAPPEGDEKGRDRSYGF